MSKWKVKEALEAAKKKLKLMMTVSEQMTTIIPSAILEVYEMNRLAQVLRYNFSEYLLASFL